jgi:hypothetical protein
MRSYRPVDRRSDLTEREFVRDYLSRNRPVVVTDALERWPARRMWTPAYFKQRFGHIPVTLQGEFFYTVGQTTLGEFLDELPVFERNPLDGRVVPYLRYSDGAQGSFTEAALAELKDDWSRPYFLPSGPYIYPPVLSGSDPTRKRYPDFGIYISPRGASTVLHVDNARTNAVLCQLHGRKRAFLFSPDQESLLPNPAHRKPENLERHPMPSFGRAEPLETTLEPGDAMFIPRAWFHEVYTLSASISLTYNFVHLSDARPWLAWLSGELTAMITKNRARATSQLSRMRAELEGARRVVGDVRSAPAFDSPVADLPQYLDDLEHHLDDLLTRCA